MAFMRKSHGKGPLLVTGTAFGRIEIEDGHTRFIASLRVDTEDNGPTDFNMGFDTAEASQIIAAWMQRLAFELKQESQTDDDHGERTARSHTPRRRAARKSPR